LWNKKRELRRRVVRRKNQKILSGDAYAHACAKTSETLHAESVADFITQTEKSVTNTFAKPESGREVEAKKKFANSNAEHAVATGRDYHAESNSHSDSKRNPDSFAYRNIAGKESCSKRDDFA